MPTRFAGALLILFLVGCRDAPAPPPGGTSTGNGPAPENTGANQKGANETATPTPGEEDWGGALVGPWHVTVEARDEEGMITRLNAVEVYDADGTYYAEGTMTISLPADGDGVEERIFTVSGPERGRWEVKDGALHKRTETMEIEFFSTLVPEVDRESFESQAREAMDEPEVLVPVSAGEHERVMKDEDGWEFRMSRIRADGVAGEPAHGPYMTALATFSFDELGGDPTVREDVDKDPLGERLRRTSLALLDEDGFTPAKGLPTLKRRAGLGGELRPVEEIEARLIGLYIAVSWVVAPEEVIGAPPPEPEPRRVRRPGDRLG